MNCILCITGTPEYQNATQSLRPDCVILKCEIVILDQNLILSHFGLCNLTENFIQTAFVLFL